MSRGLLVAFLTVRPNWFTSAGRFGCACETRFCVLTWSKLMSVSTSNVTVSFIVPSLALVDCM